MFKFIKMNKKKIALFLATASVLGGKAQAMDVKNTNSGNKNNVQSSKKFVKPLAITTAVLVPVLALGTGLIIWNVSRDKNENDDDKKNNQKPDDESKNQEGFVQEVNRRLEIMGLKDWVQKFNTAIGRIKVWRPYGDLDFGDGTFEERNKSLFEIIDGKKIEKEKIEVKPDGDRIYIYVHVNESLYYVLNIGKKAYGVCKYVNDEFNGSWGNEY